LVPGYHNHYEMDLSCRVDEDEDGSLRQHQHVQLPR